MAERVYPSRRAARVARRCAGCGGCCGGGTRREAVMVVDYTVRRAGPGRSCAGMRLGAVAVAVAGGCRFTCRSATEATQSSSSTTSLPPDAATLPNEAMTAQILSGELANLVNESKRKNPDLRSVCDHTFPSYPFPADSSLLRRQTSHCRTSNLYHPRRRPS